MAEHKNPKADKYKKAKDNYKKQNTLDKRVDAIAEFVGLK